MTRTADAVAGVLLTLTLAAIFAFGLLVLTWAPADARPAPSGPPLTCRIIPGVKPNPACQPPRVMCKPIAGTTLPAICTRPTAPMTGGWAR